MSWDDIDKQSGGAGGRFVQFENEKAVRMRILDEEPYTTRVHKISQSVMKGGKMEEVFRAIPATPSPDDSFILKHNAKRFPEAQQFNMRAFVYVNDEQGKPTNEGEIKVLQGGPQIFKQLRTIYQNEGSLTAFDIVITRKGEKRDTEYSVTAAARSRDIDVKAKISAMLADRDLQWDTIFMPITGAQQQKMFEDAGLDINYDPASKLMEGMSYERASSSVVTFGKYKGKSVGELVAIDAGYVKWAAENITTNEELAAAFRVAVKHMRQVGSAAEPKKLADNASKIERQTPPAPAPAKTEEKFDAAENLKRAEATFAPTTPEPTGNVEELKGQIRDWFESDPKFSDVAEIIAITKKHGGGKTRLKDLNQPQLASLLADLQASVLAD